jgi:hypothetical protein
MRLILWRSRPVYRLFFRPTCRLVDWASRERGKRRRQDWSGIPRSAANFCLERHDLGQTGEPKAGVRPILASGSKRSGRARRPECTANKRGGRHDDADGTTQQREGASTLSRSRLLLQERTPSRTHLRLPSIQSSGGGVAQYRRTREEEFFIFDLWRRATEQTAQIGTQLSSRRLVHVSLPSSAPSHASAFPSHLSATRIPAQATGRTR